MHPFSHSLTVHLSPSSTRSKKRRGATSGVKSSKKKLYFSNPWVVGIQPHLSQARMPKSLTYLTKIMQISKSKQPLRLNKTSYNKMNIACCQSRTLECLRSGISMTGWLPLLSRLKWELSFHPGSLLSFSARRSIPRPTMTRG